MAFDSENLLKIRRQYEKQLFVPPRDRIPTTQFFLCPVGLVGAGKTTVVRPLSEKLGLVRISSDEVRKLLKDGHGQYDQLMEIVRPLAEELAEQGYSLAFDADCGNPKTKEFIIALAERVRAKVFWVHINPPEELILTKLKTYTHTWLFKDGDEAVQNYFRQKEKRQAEQTPFEFLAEVDTSRPDVDAQIARVANLITAELVE